ncbi:MAG: hypothetical protein AAB692_03740, partial [Patescibacteria group bacterium]
RVYQAQYVNAQGGYAEFGSRETICKISADDRLWLYCAWWNGATGTERTCPTGTPCGCEGRIKAGQLSDGTRFLEPQPDNMGSFPSCL